LLRLRLRLLILILILLPILLPMSENIVMLQKIRRNKNYYH
jgi:hypothetical protein